jgi:hypothetical protein
MSTFSTPTKFLRFLVVPVLLGSCLFAISACGVGTSTGATGGVAGILATLKPLAEECDGPVNAYAGLDASATGRGNPSLTSDRLDALRDLADQAAACGGYMKVVAFSSGAAETFTLGEAEFPRESGTETARLIEAGKAEDGLLSEVEDSLPESLRGLDSHGTDVLAQLTLARQVQAQRPDGKLLVQLETDGISTTRPVVMNTPEFTEDAARAAAEQVPMPDLAGAEVRIVGIGRTTGDKPPTSTRIAALTLFYQLACQRSGAHCLVTTDYTTGG